MSNRRMPSTRSAPPRVLVIGAGPAAFSMHLPILARLRDQGALVLMLVCDIESERAAAARRKFGFLEDCCDAGVALARPDIEVVYIFAAASLHHEYGLAALAAGKHLFVEKPIAPSYAQACDMADAAQARGLIAVGGHNRRFFSSLVAARRLGGNAGWRGAEAVFHKNEFGKSPPFGARSWLSANGIHALDAVVFMMGGLPDRVAAQAGGSHVFSALMRWPDGAQGVFLCNNQAGARREDYVFHAPGQSCQVREENIVVEKSGKASTTQFRDHRDGLRAEHDAFLRAIRDGGEPVHSLAALAPSLFLCERIEEGYSGRLQLPALQPRAVAKPAQATRAVLLVAGAELRPHAARRMPQFPLVSLEEVERSAQVRGDIVAALLGRGAEALPLALLEKLPNLALVAFAGLSLSHLRPENLLARNIALVHASNAYAESVAEFALGLAILGRRRAFLSHEIMRGGGWGTDPGLRGMRGAIRRTARTWRPSLKAVGLEPLLLGARLKTKPLLAAMPVEASAARDLKGATAGLIGWGANARAFARRLAGAGVRVLVWSEHGQPDDGVVRASLSEVLAADIVSLHRGLTPATRHFLGAAELARLRPGAVLINIARGALIAPDALLARLRQGDIFACLDTYEDEPLDDDDPLRRLPNVFLSSHIAGGAPDMHAAAAEEIVVKLAAYLCGGKVETILADALVHMT